MSFLRATPFALLVLSCSGLKAGDIASPSDAGSVGDDASATDADAAASSADFFVDVNATGPELGTQASPFHTVTAGASAARASSSFVRTLRVASGTYDAAHGEVFPIDLHGGISVVGAGVGNTIVSGHGTYRPSTTGALADGSSFFRAAFVVGDPVRPATITALTMLPGAATDKPIGIVCDRGNAPKPGDPIGEPTILIDRVAIGPRFDVDLAATTTWTPVASGCNARVTGSTMSSGGTGIWAVGCGTAAPVPLAALPYSYVALRVGDGTVQGGNTFRQFSNNGGGGGVVVWDCASYVDVRGNRFSDSEVGIVMTRRVADTLPAHAAFVANTFDSLSVSGVWLTRAAVLDELRDNSFSGISGAAASGTATAAALLLSAVSSATFPTIARARGNRFIGNGIAVAFQGDPQPHIGAIPRIDFGRAGDPGYNLFRCNSSTGGTAPAGYDVLIDASPKALADTSFVGNFWDHAPPTTVTAATAQTVADGTDVVMLASTMNASIDFSSAQPTPVACPPGRTPGP